jgi:hypothetical protein
MDCAGIDAVEVARFQVGKNHNTLNAIAAKALKFISFLALLVRGCFNASFRRLWTRYGPAQKELQ